MEKISMNGDSNTLTGKVALITGAAKRLGAASARALHQQGACVVVHYHHSAEQAEALVAEFNQHRAHSAMAVPANLLIIDDLIPLINRVIERFGRLDILINNASTFYATPLGAINEQQWDDLMGSNVKAPLFLSQAALPYLSVHKGCIINMVDIHAYRPLKNYPVYTMAKAALKMLTQSLALECGDKVRVNGIAPGIILWPEDQQGKEAEVTEERQQLINKTALKCDGSPADITQAVLFLASQADYITGHIIPIDGGRLLNQ